MQDVALGRCARALSVISLMLATGLSADAQTVPIRHYIKPLWTSDEGFGEPTSVRELHDGRVIIPDAHDREIWLLSSAGKQIRQIGRHGEGPQEFQKPLAVLALPGDSTLVVDDDLERFLIVGPDAKPVGTAAPRKSLRSSVDNARAIDERGRVYFTLHGGGDATSVPLLRWDRSLDRVETVATVAVEALSKPGPEIKVGDNMTFRGRYYSPWPDNDAWVVLQDGTICVIRALDFHVDVIAPSGGVRKGTPIPSVRVAVSAAERKKYQARMELAPFKPLFASPVVFATPDREIWVGHYTSDSQATKTWDVLNAQGARIATVEAPKNKTLLGVSQTKVYFYRTDDDGLKWIEAYAR